MKRIPTKDVIAQTMRELLQKKRIEEVTVSEIAREVEISTRTFYNCTTPSPPPSSTKTPNRNKKRVAERFGDTFCVYYYI